MEKNEFQSTTCQSKQWRMLLDRTAQHTVKQNLDRAGRSTGWAFQVFLAFRRIVSWLMPYLSNSAQKRSVNQPDSLRGGRMGGPGGWVPIWVRMEQGLE